MDENGGVDESFERRKRRTKCENADGDEGQKEVRSVVMTGTRECLGRCRVCGSK
jgi:hypothetical protein